MAKLSPQLFAILSSLVEERVGIHYGPADVPLFEDKILVRMAEAGFESALDYYYFLRYDASSATELEALVETLVVGETYFFRELDGLLAAIEHVIAPAIQRRGRARIWSAACATGEEPYSLAILLSHRGLLTSSEIYATDLSARALGRAKAGRYRAGAMRALANPALVPSAPKGLLPELAETFLRREDGDVRVVHDTIKGAVRFAQVNLVDPSAVAASREFDLVLCRNVLIYFDDATVTKVTRSLAGALAVDGHLLVGTAESLLRFGTALHCEERGGAFFYVRGPR